MANRPFELVLHVTHDCNMRCSYCYAGRPRPSRMSLETARQALNLAHDFGGQFPELVVGFFGGEPLLCFDSIVEFTHEAEMASHLWNWPLRLVMTTNGTLLTDERAAWMALYGFEVTVSLDGAADSHDQQRVFAGGRPSHERVVDGIRALLRHAKIVRVAMTVTPATAGHLVENLDHVRELGVSEIHVTPDYSSLGWTPAARRTLRRQLTEAARYYARHFARLTIPPLDEKVCARIDPDGAWPCGFGWAKLAVSAEGNLYGCERMVAQDDAPRLRVGNVYDGLDEQKLIALRRQADLTYDGCRGCDVERQCQRRCACVNLARTGEIGRPDDFVCSYERGRIHAAGLLASELVRRRSAARMPAMVLQEEACHV